MSPPLIREVRVKSALTKTGGFLNGYAFSLNPYGGCQFGADLPGSTLGEAGPVRDETGSTLGEQGCPYCYVRELPVSRFRGERWGGWVDVKVNLPERLEAELGALARRDRLAATRVFCASATDPYQPIAERRYRLTRQALAAFLRYPPEGLLLQTRSTLIRHDLPLLQELNAVTNLVVSISCETDREDVRRLITPTSPPVPARLGLLAELRQGGLFVQAAVAPLLPCNPDRFARLLDPIVDRVVLDTFQLGDGSGGQRSDRLGMARLLGRHGFAEWYRPDAYRPVRRAFQEILGPDRVLVSAEGFNTFPAIDKPGRVRQQCQGSPPRAGRSPTTAQRLPSKGG